MPYNASKRYVVARQRYRGRQYVKRVGKQTERVTRRQRSSHATARRVQAERASNGCNQRMSGGRAVTAAVAAMLNVGEHTRMQRHKAASLRRRMARVKRRYVGRRREGWNTRVPSYAQHMSNVGMAAVVRSVHAKGAPAPRASVPLRTERTSKYGVAITRNRE